MGIKVNGRQFDAHGDHQHAYMCVVPPTLGTCRIIALQSSKLVTPPEGLVIEDLGKGETDAHQGFLLTSRSAEPDCE